MASKHSQKDQEMASELKRKGIKRLVMLCPICHTQISLSNAYGHIAFHKGVEA
jgi:hypothetical protein